MLLRICVQLSGSVRSALGVPMDTWKGGVGRNMAAVFICDNRSCRETVRQADDSASQIVLARL